MPPIPRPRSIGVAELKRHFAEFLDRVSNGGERVVVRRRNRDVAALVPVEMVDGETFPFHGRGLAAAAGAWAEHPEMDQFIRDVRTARRKSRDRKVPPLG